MRSHSDVVIIGGGVIGTSIAYQPASPSVQLLNTRFKPRHFNSEPKSHCTATIIKTIGVRPSDILV